MQVLITGTSSGIGKSTAELFLKHGNEVYGIDIKESEISNKLYHHIIADVSKKEELPDLTDFEIVINNAGTIEEEYSIQSNLLGYINIAEKYANNPKIQSVVNVGSISGRVGLDTPCYAASQGGRIAYTKNLAIRLGKKYHARVNCVSFGAVLTGLEPKLYAKEKLVEAVANENLLHKWIMPEEAAEWIYFVAVKNKSMTGQDILIDNGEEANFNFIESR